MKLDIEQQLRALVREELARLLGLEPGEVDDLEDDDLRARAQQRAARMIAARDRGAR